MPTPIKAHAWQRTLDDVSGQQVERAVACTLCRSGFQRYLPSLYEAPGHVSPYTSGVVCRVPNPIVYVGTVLACPDVLEVPVLQQPTPSAHLQAMRAIQPVEAALRFQPATDPS